MEPASQVIKYNTMDTQLPETEILDFELAVYKASSLAGLVDQVKGAPFFSITFSNNQLVVVANKGLPGLTVLEPACHLLQIKNSQKFQLELAKLTQKLGEHGVGIIPMSNYEGDYILIKDEHLAATKQALVG
jgi:hypothetical protein